MRMGILSRTDMNKQLLNLTTSILALMAIPCANSREPSKNHNIDKREHLLPFTQSFDPDLRPIFDKKLLLTPANYGRMIRMHNGPDVGDSVVSVYCNQASGTDAQCYVSLTQSDANLDHVRADHRADSDPFKKVREVKVVRRDAPITVRVANGVRNALKALLPLRGDHRIETVEGWGFSRIEFWLPVTGVIPNNGEAPREPGKKITVLIELGDLLGRYCEVAEAKRPAIAARIEGKTKLILGLQ
jgi:hypothetical protein